MNKYKLCFGLPKIENTKNYRHNLRKSLLRVLFQIFIPTISPVFLQSAYADDMGGLQNPIVLLAFGAILVLYLFLPLLAWLVSFAILRNKIADKDDLTSLNIDTFVSMFIACAAGYAIFFLSDGNLNTYGIIGLLLPVTASIILVIYAVRKNE